MGLSFQSYCGEIHRNGVQGSVAVIYERIITSRGANPGKLVAYYLNLAVDAGRRSRRFLYVVVLESEVSYSRGQPVGQSSAAADSGRTIGTDQGFLTKQSNQGFSTEAKNVAKNVSLVERIRKRGRLDTKKNLSQQMAEQD